MNHSTAKHELAILLSTYNGSLYLRDFLDSLLAQTYCKFDLIVRDDLSSDNSLEILSLYSSKLNIIIIDYPRCNIGATKSFQTLIHHSSLYYAYFMLADQDDIWLPDKVLDFISYMSSCDLITPSLYFCRFKIVSSSLSYMSLSRLPISISFVNALSQNIVTGCSAGFNQPLSRLFCLTPITSFILFHDWYLYLLASSLGIVHSDRSVNICYRQHGRNVVGYRKPFFRQIIYLFRYLSKFFSYDLPMHAMLLSFKRYYSKFLKNKHLSFLNSMLGECSPCLSIKYRQNTFSSVFFCFLLFVRHIFFSKQ